MKQTNNAIKFLMAQYRAIFKNAYFKGMASAVLLTAGLAAGASQAADIDSADAWAGLSGDVIVDGTGTDPNTFVNIKLGATGAALEATNNNTVNITITSGATTANYIKGASSSGALVQGDNVSITLQTTDASHGLAISGAASSGAATLDIGKFAVTKGTLSLTGAAAGEAGAATLKADTIVLGAANASDAKITFAAANTDAGWAVLEGRLTNEGTGTGTLDFTGFGTLKTYTDEAGVNVDITVATTKSATLDLSANDPAQRTLKINKGTVNLNAGATATTFTVQNGTLDIGNEVTFISSGSAASGGAVKLDAKDSGGSATTADQAVLKISSTQLNKFMSGDGSNTQSGVVNLANGTLELTNDTDISTLKFATTAGTDANGAITVSDTADKSFIKGTNLSITKTVTGDADKLTVQADKITLTELKDDGTGNSLGVGKTIKT